MRACLRLLACLVFVAPSLLAVAADGAKPLTFVDLMKSRQIRSPVISDDGSWAAWALWPDRGDGEVVARSTDGASRLVIERGVDPAITPDGSWVAAKIRPTLEEREKKSDDASDAAPKKKDASGPHDGLALLSTSDGALVRFERVADFALSGDGRFLAVHHVEDEEQKEAHEEVEDEPPVEAAEGAPKGETPASTQPAAGVQPAPEVSDDENGDRNENVGRRLTLRALEGGRSIEIANVVSFAFSEEGEYLAYAAGVKGGDGNGLFLRDLRAEALPQSVVRREARGRYTHLAWAEDVPRIAFVAAVDDEKGAPGEATIGLWEAGETREIVAPRHVPDGWFVPSENVLEWTDDGARLYFGFKPVEEKTGDGGNGNAVRNQDGVEENDGDEGSEPAGEPFDPYDVEALLEKRAVDVWHWDDPLIVPHQKKLWDEEKKRTYRAAWHADSGRVVPLADRTVREVEPAENPVAVLGRADVPYLKRITWDGGYVDLYRISLDTGERQLVARELRSGFDGPAGSLSPGGRYVTYYRDAHWHLFDGETGATRNLTAEMDVPFADEDHDYPSPAPGYGVAGWVEGDRALLIYDKYDIWQFPTDGETPPLNVTGGDGRTSSRVFRIVDLDEERDHLLPREPLLLSSYHDREKHRGLFAARVGESGTAPLVEERRLYSFVVKAKETGRVLLTRESYDEFPDLWVADVVTEDGSSAKGPARAGRHRSRRFQMKSLVLSPRRRLSEANPELASFDRGQAELVEWTSDDGIPLQGVLIKPAGYEPGKRYPVLVYFYRFFSQRLHEFNEPVVNHRPSFPVYASDGYAVFLPDIRFEIGRPGFSATKCLVPGVKKLVEMGVADPGAIGLHGHSWSGYQAAFVITQTDIFAAAVAGAPVSNMTSAYSGIRLGTGLARQFQYEKSQSRIGGSLWDARRLYIENSPVFFADRIDTPLLIQFGDVDEAVPWQQGIELYLAMRRLGKEAIFLQYRDEPHHLEKYSNKLDYSIKMKQFFDHHLKGEPAPAWMTEGVRYRGK